jgi:uncharacterized protein (TIRG00374 family)
LNKTSEVKSSVLPKKLTWSWSWWQVKLVIAGVLLYYLFSSGKLSLTLFQHAFSWDSIVKLILTGLLILLAYFFCSWRMFFLLKSLDYPFSLKLVFQINLIGFFFNNFLPGTIGGDAMRGYYFAKGRRLAPILASMVYDRLLGLMALLLLAFTGLSLAWVFDLGFVWTREFHWAFLGITIGMATLGVIYGLSCWQPFLDLVEKYIVRLPLGEAISRFIHSVASLSKYGLLNLALLGISVGVHISYALGVYFASQALGLETNLWLAIILAPLIFLSGIVPLSPNNIGWTEYLGSLIWASQGISQGGDLWMGYRLIYVLVSLGGLLFYIRLRAGALPHES